jgi:predicted lipopolysaccharide heptosyltransferase III
MNSLRRIVDSSPQLRAIESSANSNSRGEESPQPLGVTRWNWQDVRKVLIVRLRSIGDTVLTTPSICALRRFLPDAEIDILLEDWVAPVLAGHPAVNRIVTLEGRSFSSRARVARELRANRYDVVYNLHGGTTATFLTRATGARHRVGYATYQYAKLHNHTAPSPLVLWQQEKTHSAEQQLALLGWTGVPVTDRPPTELAVTQEALEKVDRYLATAGLEAGKFALIHPAAAFATKQWAAEKFARIIEFLAGHRLPCVAIAAPHESALINEVASQTSVRLVHFSFSLPEVTALASRARLFIGNDSGIAHIAAAVNTPSIVIFGSSNIAHWRPWTNAPNEVVFEEMDCQPCHGYYCEKFEQPECIIRVPVIRVSAAIDRLLGSPIN